MQTVAENKFTVTEKLFREGMKRVVREDFTPTLRKLMLAVGAAWVLLIGYTIWKGGSIVALCFELVAVVLALTYVSVLLPRSRIRKGWKALTERSGGSMERTTRFYEDRMEVDSGAGQLVVNYEDVTRVLETEHLMILQNTEGLGVMAALDGFTKGSREDVLALIKEWSR